MDKTTLMNYMPKYYKTSRVIDNINEANATELTTFKASLQDVLDQFFIETADYTLARWEQELGLEVNENYNTEYRRTRVKARMRGQGTVTVKLIKNVSESFSNGEVDVIEDNANSKFVVKFVGTMGIPPNIVDLQAAIEDIKPAHLDYTFEYTYMTFDQFDNYNKTWAQWDALNLTWDQFEVYKG